MSFQIKKAKRSQAKLKIGVSAPSGAGKTMSALLLAKGLVGDLSKVCVIDTENDSATLYSHLGDFSIISLKAPYSPQRYVAAMKAAYATEQFELIIVDSVSHEWDGPGGCLEIHESLGGQFRDWARVTPMHRDFIEAIVQAPIHMITTVRRKQDYAMEQNEKGKAQPKKVGLKEVQREGFEYELTVNFDIEMNHKALASKDRTGLFASKVPFTISEETGKLIADWNNSGAAPEAPKPEPLFQDTGEIDQPAQQQAAPPQQQPPAQPQTTQQREFNPQGTKPPNLAPVSTDQQKKLFAMAEQKGVKPSEIRNIIKKEFGVERSADLKVNEFEALMMTMNQPTFRAEEWRTQ